MSNETCTCETAVEECKESSDKIHCDCWWDSKACCACKAPACPEHGKDES